MKNLDEIIQRAAVGVPEEHFERFEALMTDIAHAEIPPSVADEHVEADPPSRREEFESLSDDEAVQKVHGSNYLAHLKASIVETVDDIPPARTRVEAKEKAREQFFEMNRERVLSTPLIVAGFLKGISLGLLACVAILAEGHLLYLQLREWLSSDQPGQYDEAGHMAVSIMIVAGMSYVVHWATDEKKSGLLRACAWAGVILFSIALGLLRAYSITADERPIAIAVAGFVWITVTLFAPLVTASSLRAAAPGIAGFINSLELAFKWRRIEAMYRADQEEANSMVGVLKAKIASLLSQFSASRKKLVDDDGSYLAMARAARRLIPALVAEWTISWRFFKRQKESKGWTIKDWVCVCAAIVIGAYLLMGCSPPQPAKRAEPVNWIVVCDRSSSSAENPACTSVRLKAACSQWARRAVDGGGRIELIVMGQAISDTEVSPLAEHPGRFEPPIRPNRAKWLRAVPDACEAVSLPELGAASGAVEGIYTGVNRLRGLPGRSAILVMSDMRQVSGRGGFNFERGVPEFDAFARWLDSQGQMDAGAITIGVCGFNLGTKSSPLSMAEHGKIRALWEKVFREKWRFANVPTLSEECRFDSL